MNDEQGRLDVFHILDRRLLHIAVKIVPRGCLKLIIGKSPTKIAAAKVGSKIGDGTVGDSYFETIVVADEPVGHKTPIASASHAHTLLVNVAFLQQRIHARHYIERIFCPPIAAYRESKLAAIAATATRIGVENNIALRHEQLHLVEEPIAILRIWSTVNLYNERVLFRWIKVLRLHNPAIHRPTVLAGIGHIFGRCKRQFAK